MKRFSGVLSLIMALCLISANVMAQDEPGGRPARGGGGGPGGFGGRGGMMGGMMGGGAAQLLGLLRMEEVRKEVNVSADAYAAIEKAQRDAFSGMMGLRDASEEDRAKAMKEMNTKAQDILEEVVDPAGMKRLMGLLLQQQGNTAVVNELIAKEIKLSDDSAKAIRDSLSKIMEENMAAMRKMMDEAGGFQNLDREMMTAMREEGTKKTNAAVDEKLTAEQKKAVEELKGAKFTFPEGGGFGRGPGGPGGPGGGRNRPNSDN